ncbi:hypothetical protein RLOC_00001877 [Lonchura striata]|uniref:Uncharacterized protein n=1 Tax=Lonchura striata TaxID=40157 RepID=A0A218UGK7_9PASE|nr:hypothetical protein RLOC_00001877 [Lonchura striata domestica]
MTNVGCLGTRAKKEQGHSDMSQHGLPVSILLLRDCLTQGWLISTLWRPPYRHAHEFSEYLNASFLPASYFERKKN